MKKPQRFVDDACQASPWLASAKRMRSLACEARLLILDSLDGTDGLRIKDIMARTGLAQTKTSNHVQKLVRAGLVEPGKEDDGGNTGRGGHKTVAYRITELGSGAISLARPFRRLG